MRHFDNFCESLKPGGGGKQADFAKKVKKYVEVLTTCHHFFANFKNFGQNCQCVKNICSYLISVTN